MDVEKISELIFEAGQLKRLPRSGWFFAGVKNPETVAEHSWRTALIGLFLAKMEDVDENKVLKMCIMHDLAETRIGDMNRVNDRYIEKGSGEEKAFEDILSIDNEFLEIIREYNQRKTTEAVVARDADLLEVFAQAKEYIELGHSSLSNWMENTRVILKTKSAKILAEKLESMDSTSWWHGLKKLPKD
ncbi:MAG: HD domain-containing protein [Candidatus Aenigmatarchaeota archaeon]